MEPIDLMDKDDQLKELRKIPGVGKAMAEAFWNVGIKRIADLRGLDPEDLYLRFWSHEGRPVHRCVFYVCRLAVYFAEHKNPDPEKLHWWYWKDAK